jgi:hypothetical protein
MTNNKARIAAWRGLILFLCCSAQARAEEVMAHDHMSGMYGPYSMNREASGTSWQPESTPHEGVHIMSGDWMLMLHGYADQIYDHQGGPRGGSESFSESMLMFMAQHPLGPGTFGFRSMLSLDPAMGPYGYPLLLQTGETGDGTHQLVDRQHPHDLFMELAITYSLPLDDDSSLFGYFGLPGEPALGPTTFMHRFSGMDIPEAPITHHWLDSTHVTEGVSTLGYVWRDWKIEGSAFRGREPDQYRWDIEKPKFDSFSSRLSYNPTRDWALQVSYGHLVSPEELEPDVNQDRLTASASYNTRWSKDIFQQTTVAFGQIINVPGHRLDGFLLESTVRLENRHTLFIRAERVDKDELFEGAQPQTGNVFTVNELSAGYIYDFARWKRTQWGVGGLGTLDMLPAALNTTYGKTPRSFMLFVRVKIV